MTDLTNEEKSLVWTIREASEAARHTRKRFLTIVSDELDKAEFDPARRPLVFEFARKQADSSASLASDTVAEGRIEDARRVLRDAAARLAPAPWHATVRDYWPAPIAHEIERLFDEMTGRQLLTGEGIDASADSALLQLKDAFEVLIKFTTTVLMRGLIETGRDDGDWARRRLFRLGLSLGHWARMLRDAVSRCTADGSAVPAPLAKIARASKRKLVAAADEFVTIRNNVIGHGSRALDPFETATLVVGCLETGAVKNLRGDTVRVTPLATVLDAMVQDGAYGDLSLEAGEGDALIGLDGAGAAERWLADERHARHEVNVISTLLRLPNGKMLFACAVRGGAHLQPMWPARRTSL